MSPNSHRCSYWERERKVSLTFYSGVNKLPSIRPRPGSPYVYSSSEPHDEEQEIDFRRLHNWIKQFEFRGVGLPVESNGEQFRLAANTFGDKGGIMVT